MVNGVDALLGSPGRPGLSTARRRGIVECRGWPNCRAAWKAAGPFRGCLGVAEDFCPPTLALRLLFISHGSGSSVLGGCFSWQTVRLYQEDVRLQQGGHLDGV